MGHLQAGIVTELTIEREAEYGYFLTDGDTSILLHKNEITQPLEVDETVEVFIYADKQGRLTATMSIPDIQLGVYGWAEVIESKENLGVFVYIGISKEILVSKDDLPLFTSVWPIKGDQLLVTLDSDKQGRLLAKPAKEEIVQERSITAGEGAFNRNISGHVYRIQKVGAFMLSIEGYRCFIHSSEMKSEPRLGELIKGRVIDVKEDGSVNVSLLPRKQESLDQNADEIYAFLELNGGKMPYSDKTSPEDIQLEFGLSKSAFKRALGKLMKEKKVYQESGYTFVNKQ